MSDFLRETGPARFDSASPEDTADFAAGLARLARPGDVYCLTGDMGAGKTVFAQGFARGLGCERAVTSPTFALLHSYEGGRLTLYHFDLYRLGEDGETATAALEGIGYEEYLYGGGVCLVEWAERARAAMPEGARWVTIRGTGVNREIWA